MGCYLNAVDTTVNKEEMTSACKNTAIASARLAGLYVAREKASLDVCIITGKFKCSLFSAKGLFKKRCLHLKASDTFAYMQ